MRPARQHPKCGIVCHSDIVAPSPLDGRERKPLLGDGWAESALERAERVGRATYLRAARRAKPVLGDHWTDSALERSTKLGTLTYMKAASRRVDWPTTRYDHDSPCQDNIVSLEAAHKAIMESMAAVSKKCEEYYRGCEPCEKSKADCHHCNRFHQYDKLRRRIKTKGHPFQHIEHVRVSVPPGKYAVTAGQWDHPPIRTDIVQVNDGGSVRLDFLW